MFIWLIYLCDHLTLIILLQLNQSSGSSTVLQNFYELH